MEVLCLLLVPLCVGAMLLNERNDVSCIRGACVLSRYSLEYDGGFRMRETRLGPCNNSICDNCVHTGKWSLSQSGGTLYVTRESRYCPEPDWVHVNYIFPTVGQPVMLVVCARYQCSRNIVAISSSAVVKQPMGACADSNCDRCNTINIRALRGSYLDRTVDSCSMRRRIEMKDFFIVPEYLLGGTDSDKRPLNLDPVTPRFPVQTHGESDNFWTGTRIFAICVSSVASLTLVITLSVCFCRRGA